MAETLKIAFYTDTYLPAVDGVVTSILNSKEELERRGHEVYIFTSGDNGSKPMVEIERNVFAVPGVKFRKYPQYRLAVFPFLSSVKLSQIKPDVMHAHTPFTMGLSALFNAKTSRIPVTGTFHTFFTDKRVLDEYGMGSDLGRKMMIRYSWPYARFFYNRCNLVIAPSGTVQRILSKHRIRNTAVVPNSVDMKRYNTSVNGDKLRKSIADDDRTKVVLYVGRMSKEKRIDILLKAAARMKRENVRFVFAGTGPAMQHYQRMATRYGLRGRVRFAGFVDQAMLPKYYAMADVFCTASTFETQGVVLLEAMASGKPVVGADSLAIKEVIKNGKNGEKFRPNDSRDCARKLEKVINNIASYKGMTDTAKEYSVKNTTDRLLDVYRDLVAGNNPI